MRRIAWAVVVLAALALSGAAMAQASLQTAADPVVRWRDGLRIETADGRLKMQAGGRLQSDFSFVLEPEPFGGAFERPHNDSEIRRGRLHLTATLNDRFEAKIEYDFAGGGAAKDIYAGWRGLPVGVRLGHMKEPFSLEELISSRFITFMERSLVNTLAPSRNMGVQLSGSVGSRTRWAMGAFRESDGFRRTPSGGTNVTGRLTHTPIRDAERRRLLHLGIAVQRRSLDGALALSARPGDHLAPKVLAVRLAADTLNQVGVEAAATIGALALQSEYVSAWVRNAGADTLRLDAYYAQASWFLTGETRPYDGGRFVRLRPRRSLAAGGAGAWEIAARYARLDLSAAPDGGVLDNVTLGLNWYATGRARLMLNYESARRPALAGPAARSLHVRMMVDL